MSEKEERKIDVGKNAGAFFSFPPSSPTRNFSRWDKNNNGRIDNSELRHFVGALRDMAFQDAKADDNHEGWVKFQLAAIRHKFMTPQKDYLTKDEFEQVMETTSKLTLFRKDQKHIKEIGIIGAGAFGIGMAVALGSGSHNVRLLITSSRKSEKLKSLFTSR